MDTRKPVIFLTGASRGIGLATAVSLLQDHGALVAAVSRSRSPEISKLFDEYPSQLLIIEADVKDESAMRKAVRATVDKYHHLDALVLNAATYEMGNIGDPESTTESWRAIFDLNFFSVLYTVQEALPTLRKSELGGRVICVSSSNSVSSTPSLGSYNTSKAALNSFCRTLGAEEPSLVTVAVHPGLTDTEFAHRLSAPGNEKLDPAFQAVIKEKVDAGMAAKPADIGYSLASMALSAPRALSGKYVALTDDECKPFRRA